MKDGSKGTTTYIKPILSIVPAEKMWEMYGKPDIKVFEGVLKTFYNPVVSLAAEIDMQLR